MHYRKLKTLIKCFIIGAANFIMINIQNALMKNLRKFYEIGFQFM
jgi:hypothetical protein